MKTITLKADDALDDLVTRLAKSQNKTKSAVIRDAILNYEAHLKREVLKNQVRQASLATRTESLNVSSEFEDTITDGLS